MLRILSIPSRRLAAAWHAVRRGLALACLLPLMGIVVSQAAAREVGVRGAEMNRFGRIVLTFDEVTKVSARAANGVLVVTFGAPVAIKGERLVAEMPAYLSTARHDPDGTGLRLALNAAFRVNVLEAGEKVFVDILPENWTGLLPSLPPDVIADLARRAHEADAKGRAEALRRQTEAPKAIKARVATLPNLMRIVFEPPGFVAVHLSAKGSDISILFDAPLTLDASAVAGQLAPSVRSVVTEGGSDSLLVRMTLASGYEARGFREDEAFVVDIAPPSGRAPAVPLLPATLMPKPSASPQEPASGAAKETTPSPKPSSPQKPPAKAVSAVRPVVTATSESLRVAFAFAAPVAAAAFERAGTLTIVFQTPETILPAELPEAAGVFARWQGVVREGAFAVVRLALPKPQIARLAPQGDAWILTVGERQDAVAQPLPVHRAVDETGRTVLGIPLTESAGVLWLDEPLGDRVAVVTAFGPARSSVKPQRFVEFSLLPTLHGLAVSAIAEDVIVRSGIDGATISRGSGLSVTVPESGAKLEGGGARPVPVVQREAWVEARLGPVLDRQRELLREAAAAAPSRRNAARIELAKSYLANELYPEASGVLTRAAQDDPTLLGERRFLILQGIANMRMGRLAEAQKNLSAPALAEDPEGLLWRAALDALRRKWAAALTGYRRSSPLLENYPEELQGALRLQAARAAIEMRDFVFADRELTAAAAIVEGDQRGEMLLLRARLDEALGRPEAAIDLYGRLATTAHRPTAAQAVLGWVELALQQGATDVPSAIAKLEGLAVAWRGDDVEAATLGRLGRLYAESGRWRDAFITARSANQVFPDHEITRALHDETARLFEELFLSGKGNTLSRVDSLALYFDFQEFTPIGRRGDEIVRRLADRLVELDLLEQAGALLQHQVDNRIFGAARATVAARLATIRLMDGKPTQALEALRGTRLPELPLAINRARMLLEARALSDLSRTDLALEVVEGESGAEVDRLRADILWNARRWREAGETHEKLVGTRWQGDTVLSGQDRSDLMRAAIAYSLADDALALDRLRAKFAAKMADSVDARTFALVTQPNGVASPAFRQIARRVTTADTLADFLAEYRKRYPDAAAAARPRQPQALTQETGAAKG